MKRILATLVALTAIAHAGPEVWFQNGLIPAETLATLKSELALNADQEAKIQSIVSAATASAKPLEQAVRERQKSFNDLLRDRGASADTVSAALTRLLEAEAPVKQLQLRTLLQLRAILTPEQQQQAVALAPGRLAAKNDLETRVRAKAEKLRSAVEALGIKPTAMTERGGVIEALIRAGEWSQADKALDQLSTDSGVNEPVSAEVPDFSKCDPGNVDVEGLKQRLADVQAAAQSVISLPLMRQLLVAKEALESAKAAQDANAAGRILTWAEAKLGLP